MSADSAGPVRHLPNSTHVVETSAGRVLVNCPPETLKYLLASGIKTPQTVLLPPDMPGGHELGSSGFIRLGINYASVEFIMYANFFGAGGLKTRMLTVTEDQARRLRVILTETVDGPPNPAQYEPFGWLQRECEATSYYPPFKRAARAADLVEIASLEHGGGRIGGLEIALEGDEFVFREAGAVLARVSTEIRGASAPLALAPPRPLARQEITLQFIGGSDGFDPAGITTCFLAYLGPTVQTQATLFDTAAYILTRLGNLGISASQISEVVLSHLHEDHLAGLPELLLMGGHRVRLLTSTIIHASLLRVLGAMLGVAEAEVAALFDFFPLDPGHPLTLDGREFSAIYAVHSIPTLAVKANALCFSGDMRYDEDWFTQLEREGVLSAERRQELTHFADGASILVQDAGGGAVHTTITPALLKSLAAKSQKLILAHTSKHNLPAGQSDLAGQIEFASSGFVAAAGGAIAAPADPEAVERVETLAACPLFARLPVGERMVLAGQAELVHIASDAFIARQGDASDGSTYVIHSGLVEIRVDGQPVRVIGRGNSIGERGAIEGEARSSTMTARGPVELLRFNAAVFHPVAEVLGLAHAFRRADWLWTQPAFAQLPWASVLDLALDFQPRHFDSRQLLFEFGDPGYECYLIVSGEVEILDALGAPVDRMRTPGEFFGGRAALYKTPRNASARAARPTEVWALPAAALQRLQMVYPHVLLHLRVVEAKREGRARAED